MKLGSAIVSIILLPGLPLAGAEPPDRLYAFQSVRYLTGEDPGSLREDATVLVRGRVIEAVGPADEITIPDEAVVIEGRGRTLLPGLIDMHVHLGGSANRFDQRQKGDAMLRAEQTVACGVTSVLDLNADESFILPLRSTQRSGGLLGLPRIFAAGAAITVPGGHGTEAGFPARVIADLSEAKPQIDDLVRRRPDVVKLMFDGGGWAGHPIRPTLSVEQVRSLTDAAHEHGFRVVVHVVDVKHARLAIEAGADALAHLPLEGEIDGPFIDLVQRSGVVVIPTLAVYGALFRCVDDEHYFDRHLVADYVDPNVVAALREPEWQALQRSSERMDYFRSRWPHVLDAVRRLHAAGVTVIPGTDSGNPATFHGEALHRELEALVEAGVSPADAIFMATAEAAQFLGVEDIIGAIRPGMEADLLLVEGNPLKRIGDLRKIAMVMRAGTPINRDFIASRTRALGIASDRSDGGVSGPRYLPLFDFEDPARGLPEHSVTTDATLGGKSSARARAEEDRGADNPTQFLRLRGEVVYRPPVGGFAGILLTLGSREQPRTDFANYSGVRFRARSNERRAYRFRLHTAVVRDLDQFQMSFTASPEWRNYRVLFENLAQVGFGNRVRFDSRQVTGIEFRIEAGARGEFWLDLDDVQLFR